MNIVITKHYAEDDEGFFGDYEYVTVRIGPKIVVSFGDYYHDKGEERAEAFVKGFLWGQPPSVVIDTYVDREKGVATYEAEHNF